MQITRKGYYTIEYDGELLKKPDGSTRQATTRDDCYEYISEDGRSGIFTIYSPNREVEVPVINVPGVSVNPVGPNVVWETNFASDGAYSATHTGSITTNNNPTGWDGIRINGNNSDGAITGLPTGGKNGSVALRCAYDTAVGGSQTINLFKHLTGNVATGYDDLYIRYHVKIADDFNVGNVATAWKWGRLWQNTDPGQSDSSPTTWTENRVDSKYAVWNFGGGENVQYGTQCQGTFGANTGSTLDQGSAGGEGFKSRAGIGSSDYPDSTRSYFDSMPGWELTYSGIGTNGTFTNNPQDFHTIEWHFQLSDGVTYGLWEIWYDGVAMSNFKSHQLNNGATWPINTPSSSGDNNVIPTEVDVSGWNMFSLFDNVNGWNESWDQAGVDAWVDVSDVVIATSRIGHSYNPTGDGS